MHNLKNTSRHSLQWKLTLLLTLLMTITCILMYFFISRSAVTGLDDLQEYMIQVDPVQENGDTPITFWVDPRALFPQLDQEIQNTKTLFRIRSIIATVVIILLSSICTYILTAKTLKPLKKLNQEISHIQAQNLSTQLEVPDTKDEIAQLTHSFNQMLSRLDSAFCAQKQFSASAAHELRTPLAVLQTNLEVFGKKKDPAPQEYKQLFSMVQEQTWRLSHLVGTLLDMTNLKSVPRSDKISLAELTEEVLCDLDPIAEQADITLIQDTVPALSENSSLSFSRVCFSADSAAGCIADNAINYATDCIITGSYVLLYRAVYNLVENAIKYNYPQGTVTLSFHQENNQAVILIKDTGIGISPENREKIFDPFFRVDKSRSRAMGGAGLGLALVSSIAQEHGGKAQVLESSENGSTLALILPIA